MLVSILVPISAAITVIGPTCAAGAAAAGAAFAAFAATFAAGAQNAGYAAVAAFASGGAASVGDGAATAGDDLDLSLVFLTSDCSGLRPPFLDLGAGAGSVALFAPPMLLDRAFVAAGGSDAVLAFICLPVSLRFIAASLLSFCLIRGASDAALGSIPALRDLDFCAAGPDDDAAAGSNFAALSPQGLRT